MCPQGDVKQVCTCHLHSAQLQGSLDVLLPGTLGGHRYVLPWVSLPPRLSSIDNDKDNLTLTRIEWHLDERADAHHVLGTPGNQFAYQKVCFCLLLEAALQALTQRLESLKLQTKRDCRVPTDAMAGEIVLVTNMLTGTMKK